MRAERDSVECRIEWDWAGGSKGWFDLTMSVPKGWTPLFPQIPPYLVDFWPWEGPQKKK